MDGGRQGTLRDLIWEQSSGTDRKAKDIERGSGSAPSEYADPYSLRDGYKTPDDLGTLKKNNNRSSRAVKQFYERQNEVRASPSTSVSASARAQLD